MTEQHRRWPAVVAWSALVALAGTVAFEHWLAFHRPSGSPPLDLDTISFLAKFLCPAPVGALIVSRRPDHAVGWVMLGIGIAAATGGVLAEGARQFYAARPDLGAALFMSSDTLFTLTIFQVGMLMLLFPTGRLPSSRWRRLPIAALFALGLHALLEFTTPGPVADHLSTTPPANPLGISLVGVVGPYFGVVLFVTFFGFVCASGASVILRFRHAEPEVQLQLKWFVLPAALLVASLVGGSVFSNMSGDQWAPLPFEIAGLAATIAMVAAIAIAILRHRLFDIELVISRTVAYVAIAGVITAVYVGVVAGLGSLLALSSSTELVLAVVATAAIAAAFQPLRARMEAVAHRLVYGDRAREYDVLAEFTARIGASQDIDAALPAMARLLAEGTGSDCASVWLRRSSNAVPAASWPDSRCVTRSFATRIVEVRQGGEILGELAVKRSSGQRLTPTEERLMDSLAGQAGLVLRNAGLQEELRQRLEELRASRQRLVSAQEEERRRLERDLHDGAQQNLVSLRMKLGLAEGAVQRGPEELQSLLAEMQTEAGEALESLRTLARGVYPPLLESTGLRAAISARARQAPLPVTVRCGAERYPREVEAAVYFCCSEALQNVVKHASATRSDIRLWRDDGRLNFEVQDDGRGFAPDAVGTCSGLQNMRDRLEALGGGVAVSSCAYGGTTVTGWLPTPVMPGGG